MSRLLIVVATHARHGYITRKITRPGFQRSPELPGRRWRRGPRGPGATPSCRRSNWTGTLHLSVHLHEPLPGVDCWPAWSRRRAECGGGHQVTRLRWDGGDDATGGKGRWCRKHGEELTELFPLHWGRAESVIMRLGFGSAAFALVYLCKTAMKLFKYDGGLVPPRN